VTVSHNTSEHPVARDDLEVYETDDGLLIYDLQRDRAHHLNPTASIIFSLCTGENDEATMAEQIRGAFQLDTTPRGEVIDCLAMLRTEGLLR
jgi:hypothetical protein